MIAHRQSRRNETVAQFLRLCLRGRWDPAALQAARTLTTHSDLDWDALRHAARIEKLGPLLYDIVREQDLVPPPVERALCRVCYINGRRNTLLLHELEEVLRHLATKDVAVILLKGAALIEAVYRDVGVRPMVDLDLLVRREDVQTTLGVLASLGYRPEGIETFPDELADWETERALSKNGWVETRLDVHWSLFADRYHEYTLPMDWFWETALPARLLDTAYLVFGPEAQLLHLCGHLVYQHGGHEEAKLLWLHDVAEVIAYYQTKIDWLQVLARAKAYDLVLPLQFVLPHLADEWHTPIPNNIQEKLYLLRPSPTEVRVFNWRAASRKPGVAETLWTVLAGMPGWQRRLAYAWRNLCPSPAYMRERYRIPHPLLVPLFYPYRWLLGLRSAARRIVVRNGSPGPHPTRL